MHLTLHADFSLRVLIYLAAHPDQLVSTSEVSEAYGISKNHLVRVVQALGKHGYIDVRPGRSGGLSLAKSPASIRLGEVVRRMEPDFNMVECFDLSTNTCPIAPSCALRGVLRKATEAFLTVLDDFTLDDVMKRSGAGLREHFLNQPLVRSMR